MTENNAVAGVYNSHNETEASIKELQRPGFNMEKLSIVGKDYHSKEHAIGCYMPSAQTMVALEGWMNSISMANSIRKDGNYHE